MESLLQYCWKHRILPLGELFTTDGRRVEVIDPGLQNRDAGPDFFNGKIKIDGELWVGNIEMHIDAQDWYRHGHHRDAAYDNVILHVVTKPVPPSSAPAPTTAPAPATALAVPFSEPRAQSLIPPVLTSQGTPIPEIVVPIPQHIRDNYIELLSVDSYPPCYKVIPHLPSLKVHGWMAALQTERLQQKTEAIVKRVQLLGGDWEHAYFVTLARTMGFGSNSDALEMWATDMDMKAAAHHRDDLFQVEALFLGQAGLIRDDERLRAEYEYLRHKFRIPSSSHSAEGDGKPRYQWKFMRMRPQNFPTARIRLLARLYHEQRTSLSQVLECYSVDMLKKHFGNGLSKASLNVLMINCVIPMLFAYGRHTADNELCERAFDLLDSLAPEDNTIVRLWQQVGLGARTAGDSQALIQLKNRYCDRKDCLRCRFGYEYLSAQNIGKF